MICFPVLTLLAAVAAPSPIARPAVPRWPTAPAAPTVLALRSAVVPTTSPQRTCERQATDTAQRAAEEAEEAEEEANRGRRREEDGLAAQRSDPPVFDPRSLSPSPSHSAAPNFLADHAVGAVKVQLVYMCFHCPYHISDPDIGKFIPPRRPHAVRMR